jgi:hypothetical protein
MPTINQLSAADSIVAGDLLPAFIQSAGDARKVSMTTLLAFMQANLTFPSFTGVDAFDTQYAVPSATGFNVAITDSSANTHLILTPTAGYAAGTITLPAVANCIDKQEVLVNCTQQVTTLTVNGNGAVAVTGEPASLGADDFFRLKYDLTTQTWYRVG